MNSERENSKARILIIAVVLLVIVAAVFVGSSLISRALDRARMSEAMRNAQAIKYALDAFASDFDGQYPNDETGISLSAEDLGSRSSNDYFRQLFMAGETQSESIFWLKGSPVASRKQPDDVVSVDRKPDPTVILQAGDCHWAYVRKLGNTSPANLPIILEPYLPGTDHYSPESWNGRSIMVRIDGSVDAYELDDRHRLRTGGGEDLFSPDLPTWDWSADEPRDLLVQPEPAP